MVISGAGAAALFLVDDFIELWACRQNMMMTDSKGIIRADRENLTTQKEEFATQVDVHTLEEAMVDADVFIGLSKAGYHDQYDAKIYGRQTQSFLPWPIPTRN